MLLYALTIVVSAFLLFQVEPIIAKIILPWFGGSAAVWTICLLFFQVVLLLGYAYAHAVVRYLKPRTQGIVHVALLLGSLAVLPIYPSVSLKPSGTGGTHLGHFEALLALTIGLPYFLLSTTGPLMQAWYAREHKGAVPYRLFALSNAGSMFALLSVPGAVSNRGSLRTSNPGRGPSRTEYSYCCAPSWRCARAGLRRLKRPSSRCASRAAPAPAICHVAVTTGYRIGAAAFHHHRTFAECGGHPVSLGTSTQPLFAELHPMLRKQWMVPPLSLSATAGGGAGWHGYTGSSR